LILIFRNAKNIKIENGNSRGQTGIFETPQEKTNIKTSTKKHNPCLYNFTNNILLTYYMPGEYLS